LACTGKFDEEAPKDPLLVRLFLWQPGEMPKVPLPDQGWRILAEARTEAA
jgi:hypothetical protein